MKKFFFLIIFWMVSYSYSQKINLYITVKDTTGQALFGSNIIIKQNSNIIAYGTTDDEGKFSKLLPPGKNYTIKISYIGYIPWIKTFDNIQEDKRLDVILKESKTDLQEIVISTSLPDFVRKKDTLIYNLKALIDGSEANLKDMIQKLPGMSINENGKVMYQGKQIDKVLVNGNDFFNTQHQLATENISAEMIKGIEYYSKYKDEFDTRTDSPIKAMNVILKEKYIGKVTGNLITAGGNEERYKIHPNIFYFKKKTNLAFIGDVNNIAEQAISLNDYMELRGGVNNFIKGELRAGIHELDKENIPSFLLGDRKTKEEKIAFGGLNVVMKKPKKYAFKGFYIYNLINNTKNIFSQKNYITGEVFNETKDLEGKFMIVNTASELKLKIDQKNNLGILITTDWQKNLGDGLISQNQQEISFSEDYDYITAGSKIGYSHILSENNILDFQAVFEYKKNDKDLYMVGNYPLLYDYYGIMDNRFNPTGITEKNKYLFAGTYSKFFKQWQVSWMLGGLFKKDRYKINSALETFSNRLDWKNRDYFTAIKLNYNVFSWHIKLKLEWRKVYLETLQPAWERNFDFLSPFVSINYLFNLSHNLSAGYYYGKAVYSSSRYLNSDYFIEATKIISKKELTDDYFLSHNLFISYGNNLRKWKFYYSLNVNYNWKYNSPDQQIQQVSSSIVLYENSLIPFESTFTTNATLHKKIFKHYNFKYDFYYIQSKKDLTDQTTFENVIAYHKWEIYSRFKKSPVNFSLGFKYSYFKSYYGEDQIGLLKLFKPFIKLNGKLSENINWRLSTSYDRYSYTTNDYFFNINPSIEYHISKKIQLRLIGKNLTNLNSYERVESMSTINYTEYKRQFVMPGYILLQLKMAF